MSMDFYLGLVNNTVGNWNYLIIFTGIVLTSFGLPFPRTPFYILAGVLSGLGIINPWVALSTVVFTAMLCDMTVYCLGRYSRFNIFKVPLLRRYSTPERMASLKTLSDDYGAYFVFAASYIPSFRILAYWFAGSIRCLSIWLFFLICILSSTTAQVLWFFISTKFSADLNLLQQNSVFISRIMWELLGFSVILLIFKIMVKIVLKRIKKNKIR